MSSSNIQINSNKEVIEVVGKVAGKPVPFIETQRREGDPAVLIASSEKIEKELGWAPQITSLEKMIASAYEWKQKFPKGYSF